MKNLRKLLSCTTALVMIYSIVTGISASAESGNITYIAPNDTENPNSIECDATEKATVIVMDEDNNIVYINQTVPGENIFNASSRFLIKNGIQDGKYTLSMNSNDGSVPVSYNFYIGLGSEQDLEMTEISGESGTVTNGDTVSKGYTVDIGENSRTFCSVLWKEQDTIVGVPLGTTITGNGIIGLQINGATAEYLEDKTIYISGRSISKDGQNLTENSNGGIEV